MMDDDIFRHVDNMMRTLNRLDGFLDLGSPFSGPGGGGFGGFVGLHHPGGFSSSGDPFDSPNFPMITGPSFQNNNRSLRDDFLEPSAAQSRGSSLVQYNSDQRVMDPFGIPSFSGEHQINQQPNQPFKSFYQVKQFSSVINGDKIETRRIETDSSGRRIESHTRKLGDKSYTVTSKADANGEQEIEEDLYNMEEKDLSQFDSMWKSGFSKPSWFKGNNQITPPTSSTIEVQAIEDTPNDNKPKTWTEKLRSWLPF